VTGGIVSVAFCAKCIVSGFAALYPTYDCIRRRKVRSEGFRSNAEISWGRCFDRLSTSGIYQYVWEASVRPELVEGQLSPKVAGGVVINRFM